MCTGYLNICCRTSNILTEMLQAAYPTVKCKFRCIILTQVWVDRRFFHGETQERQMERTLTYINRGRYSYLATGTYTHLCLCQDFYTVKVYFGGRESSVGIVTRYGLECSGVETQQGRDVSHPFRPALGPTQPPIQWVQLVRNVMAHTQKPDFVFPRNRRVHLNRWGRQFSRQLAAEVCASA